MKPTFFLLFVIAAGTCIAFEEPLDRKARFCVLVSDNSKQTRNSFRGLLVQRGEKKYLLHGGNHEYITGGVLICENRDGVVLEFPLDSVVDRISRKSLADYPLIAYELTASREISKQLILCVLDDEPNGLDKSFACAILETESLYSEGLPFVAVPVQSWGKIASNSHFGFGESCNVVQPLPLPIYTPIVQNHHGEFRLAGILFSELRSSERAVAGQVVLNPNTIMRLLAETNENR